MKLAVLAARKEGEKRVAVTPDAVKKYSQLGIEVAVETGAGQAAGIPDKIYTEAGAAVEPTPAACLKNCQLLLTVDAPEKETLNLLPEGGMVAGMLAPFENAATLTDYNTRRLATFSLELLPRISRAQAMDVLSSQSNLAGYRAVIEAVEAMGKVVPMMMTAAGTIVPAKALVLGAGVAGLQAIATARRLGAVVSAFDVRPVVKEQVESLGAKFIEVQASESGEASGGYAKEMSKEYQQKQQALIHETIVKQDMVISTALIPGKPAPVLITEAMVKDMKPGAVIVDLAAASGGNCPLTEADKAVVKHGVTLIGYTNLPSRVAYDASQLYARNLYNFVSSLLIDKEGNLAPQWEDELIKGTMLTRNEEVVHPHFLPPKRKSA